MRGRKQIRRSGSKEKGLAMSLQLQQRALKMGVAAFLAVIGLMVSVQQAHAAASEFDIESVEASLSTLEAGRHPDVTTSITFKGEDGNPTKLPSEPETLRVDLPSGLTANPENFPKCKLSTFVNSANILEEPCTQDSQVGLVEYSLLGGTISAEPLYNLESPDSQIAKLGFIAGGLPAYLNISLRPGDYGVTVESPMLETFAELGFLRVKTWGIPSSPLHDVERLTPLEAFVGCTDPCFVGGSRPSSLNREPFMTNPAACQPMVFRFTATAYLLPGQTFTKEASAGETTNCEEVPFQPSLTMSPTERRPDSPTGLTAKLEIPGDEAANTMNSSPLRSARVALPEGMTINASAANGLGSCGDARAAVGQDAPASCPDESRLGSAEITSPNLKRPLKGGIFLRSPEPGHLFRFWLISNDLGTNLKVPGEVETDRQTGRLTVVFPEAPQLPAETILIELNDGSRAPLRTPPSCGTFGASYELRPWSDGVPVAGTLPITIDQGCDVGGFEPNLSAGSTSPSAGRYSPFVFDIAREDGEQSIASLDVTLPKGLVAKLAGVTLCPEGATSSGLCPDASKIGTVKAAVGSGTTPLAIPQPGKAIPALYLAGPYKGAPYSTIATVPAQAGPFDLGVVVVRSGIFVAPTTAQVTVKTDSLPQLIEGIPLDYRRVRAEIDRKNFTLNPTSCAEENVTALVTSTQGVTASPSDRFQAADCASLGFSPKLSLSLKGGTKRTAHPALHAVLRARKGQANIRRASVALPRSEFLEQAHIRTVCTRVQFAAGACPKDSIYGRASVRTPLLDKPLSGPVYLRSSSHPLPDLVVDLRGQLHIVLSGRIDSANGGIRTTFGAVPDAPIREFVLDMKGGSKGLLVNSQNVCGSTQRADARLRAHNGRTVALMPVLKANC